MKEVASKWIVATLYAAGGIGWVFAAIQVVVDMAIALEADRMGDAFILFMLFPFATIIPMLANTVILVPVVALPCLVWAWWSNKQEGR